jgi:hypothetical protein
MWHPIRRDAIERNQESEVYSRPQKAVIPLQLIGLGETEVGPVWFGRGFAAPPRHFTVTGSVVLRDFPYVSTAIAPGPFPASGEEVKSWDGIISDPSFEAMYIVGGTIPTYRARPFGGSWWCQSQAQLGWEIDNTRASQGKASVRCAIDVSRETPWLQPLDPGFIIEEWMSPEDFSCSTTFFPKMSGIETLDETLSAVFLCPAFNPYGAAHIFQVKARTSKPATLEMQVRFFVADYFEGVTYSKRDEILTFPLTQSTIWERIRTEVTVPGVYDWTEPTTDLIPTQLRSAETQVMWRVRVKGDPGTIVWLDECLIDTPATTQPEMPHVTIGVKEWMQDENGSYIGAKLWVRSGEPT